MIIIDVIGPNKRTSIWPPVSPEAIYIEARWACDRRSIVLLKKIVEGLNLNSPALDAGYDDYKCYWTPAGSNINIFTTA